MDPESLGKMIRGIVRVEISAALDNKLKPIHEELEKLEGTIKSCKSKVREMRHCSSCKDAGHLLQQNLFLYSRSRGYGFL